LYYHKKDVGVFAFSIYSIVSLSQIVISSLDQITLIFSFLVLIVLPSLLLLIQILNQTTLPQAIDAYPNRNDQSARPRASLISSPGLNTRCRMNAAMPNTIPIPSLISPPSIRNMAAHNNIIRDGHAATRPRNQP